MALGLPRIFVLFHILPIILLLGPEGVEVVVDVAGYDVGRVEMGHEVGSSAGEGKVQVAGVGVFLRLRLEGSYLFQLLGQSGGVGGEGLGRVFGPDGGQFVEAST